MEAWELIQFFNLSNELMAIFSYNGMLKTVNPAFVKHLGYTFEELTVKPFIEFIHPDDLARTKECSVEFRQSGQLVNFENRYICKDGSIKILSWTATGNQSEDSIYAIARDITDNRKHELDLIEKKMKIVTESKMNALGRMAAGIAHEVYNPLTIIYGQANYLNKMVKSQRVDEKKLISISEVTEKMCLRIVNIINGLKTFSRDGAKDPFEFCHVNKILNDTLSFCQGKMQASGIEFIVDEISGEHEIYCRPVQISQVLLNLLNNAADAVKEKSTKRIKIEFVEEQNYVGLAVKDNGSGIHPENVNNLFQPFFTTKDIGNGTGLGLSISKGIIDVHQGRLYCDEHSPETRFVFLLPRVEK